MIRVPLLSRVDRAILRAWRRRAMNAFRALPPDQEPPDSVYKSARDWLDAAFAGKCAYCEVRLKSGEPQVEHYRPKSRYRWLVYDWRNLVPICGPCNQRKGARFPCESGTEATEPKRLRKEKPFLLHPVRDDPALHLKYDAASGHFIAVTARGEKVLELLKLNKDRLVDARKDAWRAVGDLFDLVNKRLNENVLEERYLAAIRAIRTGVAEFAAAQREAIKVLEPTLRKNLLSYLSALDDR